MTLLSDPAGTAPVSPARPVTPARPLASRRPVAPAFLLRRAVAVAVASLDHVDGTVPLEVRRRIDQMLRVAVDRHLARVGEDGPVAAVPALRVACAHLAAGDLEDAYLALLTARDLLR